MAHDNHLKNMFQVWRIKRAHGVLQTATAESLAMTTANELKRIYDLYAAAGGHHDLCYWLDQAIRELEAKGGSMTNEVQLGAKDEH